MNDLYERVAAILADEDLSLRYRAVLAVSILRAGGAS